MKKICFITATRSEYGLLKWLMKDAERSSFFEFQLVVTGAHLLCNQGHTIDSIVSDGFTINEVVDVNLDTSSTESIADSMGKMAQSFSLVLSKLHPDFVVVLGDRYELLPIVNTAFVMRIPIIHISGGDVTEGAIDDGIRNAVTMLSNYHFPGTTDSKNNIIRMRGTSKNVWAVGEPGLDSFVREELMGRVELANNLNLDSEKEWILFTFHPETKKSIEYNLQVVKYCLSALTELDNYQVVATYSNTDFGGSSINEYLEQFAKKHTDKIRVIPSLGNKRYLSYMKQVKFVIGNSSSGIVEAPFLGVPVVNIGDRQEGRHLCKNIIQTEGSKQGIIKSINTALASGVIDKDYYWGDGHASERIISILEKELIDV